MNLDYLSLDFNSYSNFDLENIKLTFDKVTDIKVKKLYMFFPRSETIKIKINKLVKKGDNNKLKEIRIRGNFEIEDPERIDELIRDNDNLISIQFGDGGLPGKCLIYDSDDDKDNKDDDDFEDNNTNIILKNTNTDIFFQNTNIKSVWMYYWKHYNRNQLVSKYDDLTYQRRKELEMRNLVNVILCMKINKFPTFVMKLIIIRFKYSNYDLYYNWSKDLIYRVIENTVLIHNRILVEKTKNYKYKIFL